jgi:hypothetical protein
MSSGGIMKIQFLANKPHQKFGNMMEIVPVSAKLASRHELLRGVRRGLWVAMIRRGHKGGSSDWEVASVDSRQNLIGRFAGSKYAIVVDSFSSPDAVRWRSMSDEEVYRKNPWLADLKERARQKWQGVHAEDATSKLAKPKDSGPTLKDRAREAFQAKLSEIEASRQRRRLQAEAAEKSRLQAEAQERARIQAESQVKKEHPKAAMRRALKERFKKICDKCMIRYGSDEDVLPALVGEKCDECGKVFGGYLKDGETGPVVSRSNPSLVILSNPDRVPGEDAARRAWARFHLAGSRDAKVCSIPDVAGLPKTVVVLGACEGFEWQLRAGDGGKVFKFRRDMKSGPWLVTDIKAKRLWIVSGGSGQLSTIPSGGFFKAIYYYPPSNSGKHDKHRGYRHEFGEGGRLPESRWHEVYPRLSRRGSRAVEMVPVGTPFRITERGIVG